TQEKRIKTHDTRSKSVDTEDNMNIAQMSSTSQLNLEQGREQIFSVDEDPTNTGSSNFDEVKNLLGGMKEFSEKIAENSEVMNAGMQNGDLNQNLNKNMINSEKKLSESQSAREEYEENFEQMTNEMISDNQLDGKEQETHNVIHNLEREEEKLTDASTTESIEKSEAEEVEQGPKKGDEMETMMEMNVTSNQVADENGFIQVTGKKNRKKTSIPIINKRPSPYRKDKEVKRDKVSLSK
ncbi:13482_t:CDS:2, partial [Cetraspora pellucida]